jgi:hypothetical protein
MSERPTRTVPLLHAVKDVLGYQQAGRREFLRGVALSTQFGHGEARRCSSFANHHPDPTRTCLTANAERRVDLRERANRMSSGAR